MEIVFPLRLSYFPSKIHRKSEFFLIAREISKSEFFSTFWKRQRKITLRSCSRSDCITFNRDIIYLPVTASEVFLSEIFFFTCRNCPLVFSFYHLIEAGLDFKRHNLWRNKKLPIIRSSCSQMRRNLFFNKIPGLKPSALLKKRLRHRCSLVNFVILFRTPILQTQTYEGMKYYQFSEAAVLKCSLK